MKVLKSFEDKDGTVSYAHIKKYNADPVDVIEQFTNGAKHMFRSIPDSDGIIDSVNKLKHISGIVITKDGDITGEYIGDYDMGLFDQRINNLSEKCDLDVIDVKPDDLNVGDVIIDMEDFSIQTFNG